MLSLDDKNGLFFTFGDIKIEIAKLYENGEFYEDNIQCYPKLTYEIDTTSFILKCNYDKYTFNLFMNGIKYCLLGKNINGVFYSFTHLEQILKKYGYKNPVYRQKSENEFHSLENPESIKDFNYSDEIIIREKNDDKEFKVMYDSMSNIYAKEPLKLYKKNLQLELLSVNLKKYFYNNDIDINLKQQISIFKSQLRINIFSEVKKLLKSKEKIFAICGPFGIGKSFTSLLLQKILYLEKVNTIYINLSNNEEISELKKTIIKESFFLNLTEEKFISLANKIYNYKINNIWDIISLIDTHCDQENIDYLLIIDQYKKKRDPEDNLNKLKVKHIFLLSSINDEDVKKNLVSQIRGDITNLEFKYVYFNNLKINDYIKNNSNNYDESIIGCLKDFNYLPNVIFLLEYVFNKNVLDFYNYQYQLELKKLSKFYKLYNISYLSNIFVSKQINDSKAINPKLIGKEEFLNNINDITLKYISYRQESNNNYFSLYYSFDYAKYPIENEINYYIAKQRFNSKSEPSLLGGEFENILKHKFILDKPLFEIDSFIIVNKIVDMELSEEYKNIKVEHLKEKKCVFISQSNFYGQDYNFAVLYPIKKEIILIQAQYKITSDNTHKKSRYSDMINISVIYNSINQKLGIDIKKIYLLYMSSVEYNYQRKTDIDDILNSKMINCIFYSINLDYFTSDFENNLSIINPTESMEIYPNPNVYINQIFSKNRRTDELLFSLMISEQQLKNNDKFLLNEYKKFLNSLMYSHIKTELKKHLGEFQSPFSNNYRLIPNINFNNYLLFFQIGKNKEIDFSKNLILVYDDINSLTYYNITTDKILKNYSIRNKFEYRTYYYVIGKWVDNNGINFEEDD